MTKLYSDTITEKEENKNNLDTLLLFPPGWTPYSPYLALPLLKGWLNRNKIKTEWLDCNQEFFNSILTKQYILERSHVIKASLNRYDEQEKLDPSERKEYQKLLAAFARRGVAELIEAAIDTLRSPQVFCAEKKQKAEKIIARALLLISASFPNTEIMFNSIFLSYKSTSTDEILKAAQDEKRNPFISYYKQYVIPLLQINKPKLIGISITGASQLIPAITLARLIRQNGIKTPVAVGGNFITRISQDWSLEHPLMADIDFLVRGDGEKALLQIAENVKSSCSKAMVDIPGVLTKNGWSNGGKRTEILAVEALAVPDFKQIKEAYYFNPDIVYPLFASRGCHGKCAFCTIASSTNGKYRTMTHEQVFAWMEAMEKTYGAKYFSFIDETLPLAQMRKLALLIAKNKKNWHWYGETRFSPLITSELCNDLKAGGCQKIQFGLESYNQRILDLMQKQTKLEWIDKNIHECLKAGIGVHLFFMVGFPGETKQEAINSITFAQEILKISKEKYNIHSSTIGWGSFGLDKYSPVWHAPETYNIEVIAPEQKHDLQVQFAYRPKNGMTLDEINSLVNELNNNPLEKPEKEGLVFGNEIRFMFKSEEFILLQSATEEQKNKSKAQEEKSNLPSDFSFPFKETITFSKHGWNADQTEPKPHKICYNCISGEVNLIAELNRESKKLSEDQVANPVFSQFNVVYPTQNEKFLIFNWRKQTALFTNKIGITTLQSANGLKNTIELTAWISGETTTPIGTAQAFIASCLNKGILEV